MKLIAFYVYHFSDQVLRLMKGYDEYNTILLPPRPTGDKLPPELMDYYEEQIRRMEESEKARREAEEAEETARREAEEGKVQDSVARG